MQAEIDYVTHLPSFYQNLLLNLHKTIELPAAQINVVLILIANIIFGLVYSLYIQTSLSRQRYGALAGLISMYILYGWNSTLGLLLYLILMYPVIKYFKNPYLIFIITLSVLFISLAYMCYLYYPSWRLDFTMSLMCITVRLQMLTWDLFDYTQQEYNSNINTQLNHKISEKRKDFYRYRNQNIRKDISFFQYLGYNLFFIHVSCGSILTIKDYLDITNRVKAPKPPTKQLLRSFSHIMLVVFIFICGKLWNMIFLPDLYSSTKSLSMIEMIIKGPMISIAGYLGLFKYLIAWTMLDFTAILSGISYSNMGDKPNWNRAKNVNVIPMLYPYTLDDIAKNWNMTIEHWLNYYVGHRLNVKKSMYRVIIVKLTAAVFHGVYPGYYIFFFMSFIVNLVITPIYKKIKNTQFKPIWPLCVIFICGFHFHWILNMNVYQIYQLMNNIYWIPIHLLIVLYIIGKLL